MSLKTCVLRALIGSLLIPEVVGATDGWFCTETASSRSNNVIEACGIGYGSNEATARLKALDNAKAEVAKLCDVTSDCYHHELSAAPARTECLADHDKGFKCYRMVRFKIGQSIDSRLMPPTPSYESERPKPALPVYVPEDPALVNCISKMPPPAKSEGEIARLVWLKTIEVHNDLLKQGYKECPN